MISSSGSDSCKIISKFQSKKNFRSTSLNKILESDDQFELRLISSKSCHNKIKKIYKEELQSANTLLIDQLLRFRTCRDADQSELLDVITVTTDACLEKFEAQNPPVLAVDISCVGLSTYDDLLYEFINRLNELTRIQRVKDIRTGSQKSYYSDMRNFLNSTSIQSAISVFRQMLGTMIAKCITTTEQSYETAKSDKEMHKPVVVLLVRYSEKLDRNTISDLADSLHLTSDGAYSVVLVLFHASSVPLPLPLVSRAQHTTKLHMYCTSSPSLLWDSFLHSLLCRPAFPLHLPPQLVAYLHDLFVCYDACVYSATERICRVITEHFSSRCALLSMCRDDIFLKEILPSHKFKRLDDVSCFHPRAVLWISKYLDARDVHQLPHECQACLDVIVHQVASMAENTSVVEMLCSRLRVSLQIRMFRICSFKLLRNIRNKFLPVTDRLNFPSSLLWCDVFDPTAVKRSELLSKMAMSMQSVPFGSMLKIFNAWAGMIDEVMEHAGRDNKHGSKDGGKLAEGDESSPLEEVVDVKDIPWTGAVRALQDQHADIALVLAEVLDNIDVIFVGGSPVSLQRVRLVLSASSGASSSSYFLPDNGLSATLLESKTVSEVLDLCSVLAQRMAFLVADICEWACAACSVLASVCSAGVSTMLPGVLALSDASIRETLRHCDPNMRSEIVECFDVVQRHAVGKKKSNIDFQQAEDVSLLHSTLFSGENGPRKEVTVSAAHSTFAQRLIPGVASDSHSNSTDSIHARNKIRRVEKDEAEDEDAPDLDDEDTAVKYSDSSYRFGIAINELQVMGFVKLSSTGTIIKKISFPVKEPLVGAVAN